MLRVQLPAYMRGTDGEASCRVAGTVPSGPHQGDELVSCAEVRWDKAGATTATVGRYLRGPAGWTYLPCASEGWDEAPMAARLVEQRIKVTVDAGIAELQGLQRPEKLAVSRGSVTLQHRTPSAPDTLRPIFQTPEVGQVFAGEDALYVPHPDGTALVYTWQQDFDWSGEGSPAETYDTRTLACDGAPKRLMNLEPGVRPDDLQTVHTLADGTPVGRLKDPAHPVNQRLLAWYKELNTEDGPDRVPETTKLGLSASELLATDPWLFVTTPWGDAVRLMRKDYTPPLYCEPIVYAYADPPEQVFIGPAGDLTFTRPPAREGLVIVEWGGVSRPSGPGWTP